jgi:hypothetical protein
MTRIQMRFWRWALLVCFACLPAFAQQNVQFLPEVDAYLKLNSTFRVYVEAKDDQDGGDSAQAGSILPSFQKMDTRTKRLRRRRTDLFKPNPASGEFRAGHLTQNIPVLEIGFRSV